MTIDLVLACLQTLFLSLYGMGRLTSAEVAKMPRTVVIVVIFSVGIATCYLVEGLVSSNIQLTLLLVLALNYLLSLRSDDGSNLVKLAVSSGITLIAYLPLYFQLNLSLVWLAIPLVLAVTVGLLNSWTKYLANFQEYFLKAGTLITLLFMAEPVILSIQQNLKPVATIPLSSIINQENLLLLGGLLVLVIGGFIWKEKIRP